MPVKKRADILAHEQGLAETREKARALIMANRINIEVNGQVSRVLKPGHLYPDDSLFSLVKGPDYVSRGAYKLLTILDAFHLDVHGKICLDAGASTGGFTDCLLKHGAARVYAIDVGKHQLHEKLVNDARVINHEGINLRYAPRNLIPEQVDFLCGDVSFISLTQILPSCIRWLKPDGIAALLIKPQFELDPKRVHKGVVRKEEDRQEAVAKILEFCEMRLGMKTLGCLPAQIRGPKGNQEYMALLSNQGTRP